MAIEVPVLSTARLRLRPFTYADKDAIFAIFSSPKVLQFWDSPAWTDPLQAEQFIQQSIHIGKSQSAFRLAVDHLQSDSLIGQCALFDWSRDFRSIRLGYCFSEASWGNGFATEVVAALLPWAFDTLDVNRVQAETDTRNDASGRVLLKNGFVLEGTLREDCIVNGEVSDSHVYGLLRRDRATLTGESTVPH